MKVIEQKIGGQIELQYLEHGDVFAFEEDVFMYCKEPLAFETPGHIFCVELKTGEIFGFSADTEVIPVEATTFYKTTGVI